MSLYLVFILIKVLGIHSKDLPLVLCALLLFSYGKGPNKMGCKKKQGKCTRHTKAKRKRKYELPVAKHIPKPNPTTNPTKQRLVFLIKLQKHVNKALIFGQLTSITPPIKSIVFSFPITHNKKKKKTHSAAFWSNLLLSKPATIIWSSKSMCLYPWKLFE